MACHALPKKDQLRSTRFKYSPVFPFLFVKDSPAKDPEAESVHPIEKPTAVAEPPSSAASARDDGDEPDLPAPLEEEAADPDKLLELEVPPNTFKAKHYAHDSP